MFLLLLRNFLFMEFNAKNSFDFRFQSGVNKIKKKIYLFLYREMYIKKVMHCFDFLSYQLAAISKCCLMILARKYWE